MIIFDLRLCDLFAFQVKSDLGVLYELGGHTGPLLLLAVRSHRDSYRVCELRLKCEVHAVYLVLTVKVKSEAFTRIAEPSVLVSVKGSRRTARDLFGLTAGKVGGCADLSPESEVSLIIVEYTRDIAVVFKYFLLKLLNMRRKRTGIAVILTA